MIYITVKASSKSVDTVEPVFATEQANPESSGDGNLGLAGSPTTPPSFKLNPSESGQILVLDKGNQGGSSSDIVPPLSPLPDHR